MAIVRRVLQLIAGALAFAVYVWFAAVRNLGRVKRRKALRRKPRSPRR